MVRLYFYVEGQSEQAYVKRALEPHLARFGVWVMGSVLAATRKRHGVVSRGGGRHYQPMRNDLGKLLRQENGPDVRFTTMFDLYGLYNDFPGWDDAEKLRHIPRERVVTLEQAFADDVNDRRFLPHIQLHEFETILLCEPEHFALVYPDADAAIKVLRAAVDEATSPELVNDGETTAPSKRIVTQFPEYERQKKTIGVDLAECVGIDTVRRLCPHFDNWLNSLEGLGIPPENSEIPRA